MDFAEHTKDLAPLETFDTKAFIGDNIVPQAQCNFILALALAYNDFRDSILVRMEVTSMKVEPESTPTTAIGLRNGLSIFAERTQVGFIREMLALVENNVSIMQTAAFKKLVKSLSAKGKNAWESICSVATQKKADQPLAKALVVIRNKVAFHYDAEQIGNAYKQAFLNDSKYGSPLLSRGSTMRQTRFYFVDAVAQEYIQQKTISREVSDLLNGQSKLLEELNQAVYELITKFINSRSPWKKYKSGT